MLIKVYIDHFWLRNPSHYSPKQKNFICSQKFWFFTRTFFWKIAKNLCYCALYHHLPTFLEPLQALKHNCKAIPSTVLLKHLTWQFQFWAESCQLSFKSCFYSSIPTSIRICFSLLWPKDPRIHTALQTR